MMNVLRAGEGNPLLRLRQGDGACMLLEIIYELDNGGNHRSPN